MMAYNEVYSKNDMILLMIMIIKWEDQAVWTGFNVIGFASYYFTPAKTASASFC
jgi:hypothetical protein